MRVLLIHPRIRTNEPPRHPPYGLLQLAAITDQYGFKIAVLDNNAFRLPIDAVRQEIKPTEPKTKCPVCGGTFPQSYKNCPTDATPLTAVDVGEEDWDIIGIGGLTTQYRFIKELVPVCREENPDALIVGGGGFMTAQPRQMLKWLPNMDIGVVGEAYLTWQEVMDHVHDRNWKNVKGLVYRDGKKIRMSKMRPLIPEEDLDEEVPWPAYEFSPVRTYIMASAMPYAPECLLPPPHTVRLDVLSSYGCPWRCTFCFHNGCTPYCQSKIYGKKVKGKEFRQHSPQYIVNLIQHLRMVYGINFVSFIDENMSTNKQWFAAFCDELEETGLAVLIHWGMVCHTKTVSPEMLQRAKDVGCSYISYGGESSVEKHLKAIGKGQTKETMAGVIQATQAAGINAIMSFIVGFRNTTIDDVIEDCQFFIDNRIHVDPFFLQPYPGSQVFDETKDTIIQQYLTEPEKRILADNFTFTDIDEAFQLVKTGADIPSKKLLRKRLPVLQQKVRETALERWVLSLDDATKLSVNLTDFNDVELAGLKYMLSTWNLERLKKFKRIIADRKDSNRIV